MASGTTQDMASGKDGLRARTVTLPPDPTSPARARELLRQVLLVANRLDCLDAAELACTELVTNAVLHAHTTIDVTVEAGDVVRVEVRDHNPSLPTRRQYEPQATTGRGLALVAAVTDSHGITDAGTAGKTMWFTVGDRLAERSDDDLLSAWDTGEWDVEASALPPAAATPTSPVRLLAVPSALWLAARQHHDALLRELALYAAWHEDLAVDLVATDRARSLLGAPSSSSPSSPAPGTLAGTVSGTVSVEPERWHPPAAADPHDGRAPQQWRPAPVDLVLELPQDSGGDFAAMQDTLDVAEELARAGQLLTRPALAEVVAVRDWACDQVVAQLAGVPPSRWPGADQERFADEVHARAGDSLDGIDLVAVRCSSECVAVADDSNRIVAVSEPLARLVGHPARELEGRRIVVLVPPRLREAHVAGFTRHLSTGEVHVIGTPVTVPVLHVDGREILCRLLIGRSAVAHGRSMYVASFEPVQERSG